jgi:hypothetical protein
MFVILRSPTNGDVKGTEPPTVYVDGFTGDLYLDKPSEIEQKIVNAALDDTESRDLIKQEARELSK